MTDRLQDLEIFVAVADTGGFSRAAARLRLSPPAVTRAVARLEEQLGGRLLHRTTRRLSLTEAGLRFLDSARRLLADYAAIQTAAAAAAATPQGHLALTAPVTFGRALLAPVLRAFLASQPQISAALLLTDRVVNLVEEGLDAGVRIGELPDSSLVARRIGSVRRQLVASPAYLKSHGTPMVPADLKRHSVIAFTGLLPGRDWRYREGTRTAHVRLAPRLEVNDALAALAAAEAGEGVVPALSYVVAAAIAAGRLVPVLERFAPAPLPVQIVFSQARQVAPKVRAFVDFAAPRLAVELDRLPVAPPKRTVRRR